MKDDSMQAICTDNEGHARMMDVLMNTIVDR